MNILLLTHSYPDVNNSWRGSFVKEQAVTLSTHHDVTVVFFKIDYAHFAPFAKYAFYKTKNGTLTEYTVTIKRSLPVINQVNYLFKTYKFICNEILSAGRPDLIHSHLSYPAGLLGTLIQHRKKIPGFITEHSRIKSYFRSPVHKQAVCYALKKASAVIAVSNPLKEEIYSLTNRSAVVINNIVDIDRFKLSGSKPEGILNIGFLGGLGNSNKGLDLLLKAVSLIENKDFILHIGGKGALLNDYKQLAEKLGVSNNCRFYGEILLKDVPAFYSGLNLFILPSRYETFGIVLIEAMACGIPVIATRCGGPEEIVTEATGLLVQKDKPEELAGAISKIAGDRGSYDKEAIRRYADDKFGRKVFISKITTVYEDTLKEKALHRRT